MEVKVLGPVCAKCNKTEKLVQEVIKETGVDVRSKEEAQTLPIKFVCHDNVTAMDIPIYEIPERLEEIPRDKPVGLFCPATIRSAMVYALLLSKGYENIRILEGGYPALTEAMMPPRVLQAVQAASAVEELI